MRIFSRGIGQLALLLWTLFSFLPFVLILLLSVRDKTAIFSDPLGLGGSIHLENYASAWVGPTGSSGMGTFLLNSVTTAFMAVLTNFLLGATSAYFITGLSERAQRWLLTLFLSGQVIPFVLYLVPYYQVFQRFGLIDDPVSLGIAYGVLQLPTTVLVLAAFFQDFPEEIREAAALDGLGGMQTFLRIVLPMSTGPIIGALLLMLVWVWNEAQLSIIILRSSIAQTVPIGLLGFQGQFSTDYGPLLAGLTIAVVPLFLLYLVFNKTLSRGVEIGGMSK